MHSAVCAARVFLVQELLQAPQRVLSGSNFRGAVSVIETDYRSHKQGCMPRGQVIRASLVISFGFRDFYKSSSASVVLM
jgi:hypothetical protein